MNCKWIESLAEVLERVHRNFGDAIVDEVQVSCNPQFTDTVHEFPWMGLLNFVR